MLLGKRCYGQLRAVHQRHGTSEYAFLPHELPSELKRLRWSETRAGEVSREVEQARLSCLELYPGVMPTLITLKGRGVTLVGYTESMAVYTARRVKALGLNGVLDAVYSPEGHDRDSPRSTSFRSQQFGR
jgi:FMN phosphatase YigB (HAD superfamily)